MSKKIGCFIGATLALFGGALWLNYSPDDFPLVVFLELMIGWTLGFLFRKFIDEDAFLRRDNEIIRLEEEVSRLEKELEKAKKECTPVVEVKAETVPVTETSKSTKVKTTKSSKNKKIEKKVVEQNKD